MYDELVKHLREPCQYENCVLCKEAADAIEDLEFACNRYEKDYKALCAYLPKWIPVTERLPEEKHAVLVWQPQYLNSYVVVLSEGEWFVYGGYGTKVFGVTHWMPLPHPPKEEENVSAD